MTSRLTEILMALPATIILLAVIGVIGTKIYLVMAILGVMISAGVYRVMLGVAQSVRQRLYVDAARVNGLGSLAGQPPCTCCRRWRRSPRCRPRSCSASAC